jgi:hypothetical protein
MVCEDQNTEKSLTEKTDAGMKIPLIAWCKLFGRKGLRGFAEA